MRLWLLLVVASSSITSYALPAAVSKSTRSIEARENQKDKGLPKYFYEPGGSMLGNHYDSRYYKGIDNYEDRRFTQSHMLRAYFTFFAESGMETWLAHGTLLGWWWNGKVCGSTLGG